MPLYEYRCEACDHQYEIAQSVNANPEETICPKCNKAQSRRLMSSFASKIVGTHKPGFSEDKAYNMLNERMSKFAKLPPSWANVHSRQLKTHSRRRENKISRRPTTTAPRGRWRHAPLSS
jgi:putative FmdB family regulatory protein